jgi:hypothetical protein
LLSLALIFGRFQKHPHVGLPPETTSDIIKAALQHCDYRLFTITAGSHRGHLSVNFFDWAKEWLDTLPESERLEKYQKW